MTFLCAVPGVGRGLVINKAVWRSLYIDYTPTPCRVASTYEGSKLSGYFNQIMLPVRLKFWHDCSDRYANPNLSTSVMIHVIRVYWATGWHEKTAGASVCSVTLCTALSSNISRNAAANFQQYYTLLMNIKHYWPVIKLLLYSYTTNSHTLVPKEIKWLINVDIKEINNVLMSGTWCG